MAIKPKNREQNFLAKIAGSSEADMTMQPRSDFRHTISKWRI